MPDEAIHFDLIVEMVKDLYRQEQSTSPFLSPTRSRPLSSYYSGNAN